MNIARGKYIQFVDNDDLLMSNALETLYNYAENYNADVVCMNSHFIFDKDSEKAFPAELKIKPSIFNEPFVVSENIAEHIKTYYSGKIVVMPWLNFSRRNFLIENDVYFPKIKLDEDDFWIIKLITRAKKILCIPNALCINRNTPTSITRKNRTVEQQIGTYMIPLIVGMKFYKEIFDETEFFQENPQYQYIQIERIANYFFGMIFNHCRNLNPYEVYKIFKEQFSEETGEHSELISYLCSMINSQQKLIYMANSHIAELEKQLEDCGVK